VHRGPQRYCHDRSPFKIISVTLGQSETRDGFYGSNAGEYRSIRFHRGSGNTFCLATEVSSHPYVFEAVVGLVVVICASMVCRQVIRSISACLKWCMKRSVQPRCLPKCSYTSIERVSFMQNAGIRLILESASDTYVKPCIHSLFIVGALFPG